MMSPPTWRPSRQLWRYLWAWTLLALLLIWVTLAGVSYYTGMHEAQEITDGQLVSTAQLLVHQTGLGELETSDVVPPVAASSRTDGGYAPTLHVVVWEAGRIVWDPQGLATVVPSALPLGHHTLEFRFAGQLRTWRAYVADAGERDHPSRRIAVMVDTQRHAALGRDIALHIVRPALILLPLVALVLAWAIRRGLRPLGELTESIAALDVDAGQTLPARQPFRELAGIVHAINSLVGRLQAQWRRERRFTSDVAHELRTPLTSLVWQSRLASESEDAPVRGQALRQVEQDAMRAGRILSQLLDLARAENLDDQALHPVDLCALGRQVVSDHVPLAHQLGQELALDAPDEPLRVNGRAAMLELALRNLIDNALRHTPPGTQVEVRVARLSGGEVVLSVSDDGAREGNHRPAGSGMGVGLTLVERIADAHGALLRRDGGEPPFTTRYALTWIAS
jgi:two-component system sensor histidine kinase QseC